MKSHGLPTPLDATLAVWSRNFLQFRKTWAVSLFWILLEPVFILGALGYGLGSYVSQVEGLSYLEFFFPALLCNTVMMVTFFETTYANYTKLSHVRLYHTMLAAPLSPAQLLAGEVLWSTTKSMVSVVGILIVAGILGSVPSWRILMALPILFLCAIIFSLIGMLVTSKVKNYDQIIYPTSGLIVPLSLFSGTYFPLEGMPKALQILSYLSPLTHAVSAARSLQQGNLTALVVLNVAFLVLLVFILWRLVRRWFENRLIL